MANAQWQDFSAREFALFSSLDAVETKLVGSDEALGLGRELAALQRMTEE
ncbi:hypothetical protein [Mycobacterium neumannii]|nr:hypothetical protein [Mycobacterium neumannii]